MNDLSKKIINRVSDSYDKADLLNRKLQAEYITALDEINKNIADFYMKYATKNSISYTEAIKYLNQLEMIPFRKKLVKYKEILDNGNIKLAAQIDALAAKSRITRLESLVLNIQYELTSLQNIQSDKLTTHLTETYTTTYVGAATELASIGMKASFATVNTDLIKKTIDFPWSGQSFSETIWNNTELLVTNLRKELVQGFIQGSSVQKMAKNISKRMDVAYGSSVRLVATETAHVISKASLAQYTESGIDKVEFCAVLDNKTSTKCTYMHGSVIHIKNAVIGQNIPPLHPNCRSIILPVIDDENTGNNEYDSDIILQGEYSNEYKQKLIEYHGYFKTNGYNVTEHGLNNIVGRVSTGRLPEQNVILETLKNKANYIQPDGNHIKMYNGMAAIIDKDNGKVITVVPRKNKKTDWEVFKRE